MDGGKPTIVGMCVYLYILTRRRQTGIRNYVARNNLRAMKKGELAFFYHSNCKEPGIVGTMEIVQEHSPDRKK